MYWHLLDVTELRDPARKSLEKFMTSTLEELTDDATETTPIEELGKSMALDWDAFEAELGVTYPDKDTASQEPDPEPVE